MFKLIVVFLIFSAISFGQTYWPSGSEHLYYRNYYYNNFYRNYYRNLNYRYYNNLPGISGAATTAIGIGAGLAGYIIGSKTAPKKQDAPVYQQDASVYQNIECKEFPVKVKVEGKEVDAKIQKCRVGDGPWQIP